MWGPGTLKKLGALLYAEWAPLIVLVPLTAVWGLGTPAITRVPGTAFPLT